MMTNAVPTFDDC